LREDEFTLPILIRNARQLLTLRGPKGPRRGIELSDLGLISHGAVLIRNGVVEDVGPAERVENLARARSAMEINAAGRVVMPAFVDSHTHFLFPPPRPAGEPPVDDATAVRSLSTVSGHGLERRGRGYLQAMARHGTTTVECKTGCGLDQSAERKVLRALAALQGPVHDVVPTVLMRFPPPDESLEKSDWDAARLACCELLPKMRKRRLVRFADVQWDPAPWRQELFRRYMLAATELGLGCKIHADDAEPAGAIRLALAHHAVSVDHLEYIGPADSDALAHSKTVATLLPTASLRHGRYAPARALIDNGAAVALATNFNPSLSPSLNMQTAISVACLSMQMSPAEAVSAATVNGALATGLLDRGQLTHGMLADVLILNAGDYRELPEQLGTNLVHLTMKRGAVVYREGEVEENESRGERT
jgi:imidazolonepropionase